VDYNVSRHIDSELVNNDWDVMILHYLGLDHIGHLAGPGSPLVQPKLKEMDAVIQKIHTSLNKQVMCVEVLCLTSIKKWFSL
jgi:ethanolaminephosphotransferase